jgi:hypothetical protein
MQWLGRGAPLACHDQTGRTQQDTVSVVSLALKKQPCGGSFFGQLLKAIRQQLERIFGFFAVHARRHPTIFKRPRPKFVRTQIYYPEISLDWKHGTTNDLGHFGKTGAIAAVGVARPGKLAAKCYGLITMRAKQCSRHRSVMHHTMARLWAR